MSVKRDDLGFALITANFLLAVVPTTMQLERYGRDSTDSRRSLLLAGAVATTVGLGATMVADSILPLAATLVVLGLLAYSYESRAREATP